MQALSLLIEEDIADCQDISLGQRRLLVHYIVGTFPLGPAAASSDRDPRPVNATNQNTARAGPSTPQSESCSQHNRTTGPSPEAQETYFIRNVLGQLYGQHAPVPTSDSSMVSWQDPQIFVIYGMSEWLVRVSVNIVDLDISVVVLLSTIMSI